MKHDVQKKSDNIVALLLTSAVPSTTAQKEICIVPKGSVLHKPCKLSIDEFCTVSVPNDIMVTLLAGKHELSKVCEMQDVNNITFRGEVASKVAIVCSPNAESGFRSVNTSMLTLANIEFKGCSATAQHNMDKTVYHLGQNISSALIFLNGSDLTLNNVTISDSTSPGFYIYDVTGVVNIDLCSVQCLLRQINCCW